MKAINVFALCLFLVCLASVEVLAKDWKGIIPLHSTRTDVERILKVTSSGKESDLFQFAEENVLIFYSQIKCTTGDARGWKVPIGTVTDISVFLKKRRSLSEILSVLNMSKDSFNIASTDAARYFSYSDEIAGVNIDVQGEFVTGVFCYHSAKDSKLGCESIKKPNRTIRACPDLSLLFDPSGTYYEKSSGMFDVYCLVLRVRKKEKGISGTGEVYSLIGGRYKFSTMLITEEKLSFVTEKIEGISYKFTGNWGSSTGRYSAERIFNGALMLRGEMVKLTGGKTEKFKCYFLYRPEC